jgi:hypothetical protein
MVHARTAGLPKLTDDTLCQEVARRDAALVEEFAADLPQLLWLET